MTRILKLSGHPVRLSPFSDIVNVGWGGGPFATLTGFFSFSGAFEDINSLASQTGPFLKVPFTDELGSFSHPGTDWLEDVFYGDLGHGGEDNIGFFLWFVNLPKIYSEFIDIYEGGAIPRIGMNFALSATDLGDAPGTIRFNVYNRTDIGAFEEFADEYMLGEPNITSINSLDLGPTPLFTETVFNIIIPATVGPHNLADWVWDYGNRGDPEEPAFPFFELT
jgi:hypothetical protein